MGSFRVVRSTVVNAPAATVHALIDDFHEWRAWSPWEDVDPALSRIYSGTASGVGARYAWEGNRKAGKGSMEITSSTPTAIGIRLSFVKPWQATNEVTFTLRPAGDTTAVDWTMTGEHAGLMGLIGRVVPMDRLVGKDFERGLARLKAAAESAT